MRIWRIIFVCGALNGFCQALLAQVPSGNVLAWGVIEGVRTNGNVMLNGKALDHAIAVSAEFGFGVALRNDGTVVGWGQNQVGRATGLETPNPDGSIRINGQTVSNVVSIAAANSFSLARKADGTVITWGDNIVPVGLSNVVAISAHQFQSLALKSDGTAVWWSSAPWNETHGKLNGLPALSNLVAISSGGGGNTMRNLGLKKDGTVVAWGGETIYGDATPPKGLSNVVAVAAGYNHSLALRKDGTVCGWGFNGGGQATGVPTISDTHITNGTVTLEGEVLSNVVAIAASTEYSLALKRDGTVVGWGRVCPKIPSGLTNVIAISAGESFCLAITTNSSSLEHKK